MNYYVHVLKNYANFNGRARRSEYWWYTLINILIVTGITVISSIIPILFFLYPIYMLATLIPSLAVAVRRMHDSNKSGWMLLVSLIPIIGGIWLLILLLTEGTKGDNQYGPDPKAE